MQTHYVKLLLRKNFERSFISRDVPDPSLLQQDLNQAVAVAQNHLAKEAPASKAGKDATPLILEEKKRSKAVNLHHNKENQHQIQQQLQQQIQQQIQKQEQ